MIHFDKVFKYYSGKSPGLIDVSVEIPEGEFVFLIGPSGSGKTTFLRLLIRDLMPSTGTIKIDGHDIKKIRNAHLHLLRRKVGIVFQDFKLLHDRTVEENVAMVLEILGKPTRDIAHGVHNVLSVVGLTDKKHMFPQQLSAGEMQRASIARAIVGGPKILLADEPTGNLDPETAWGIMDIFQEVNALGTTVVIASHNADIVNKLKKRTLTLQKGHVVRDEARGKYHLEKHEKHDRLEKKDDKGGKHNDGD
jgi:cell division transport system ATP-binding protein